MSHWHYTQLELEPDDLMVRPTIGPETHLTYEQARAEIQGLLDQVAGHESGPREPADTWRRGAVDDWVYHGPFTWTMFACSGPPCEPSIQAFLDDYAATLRDAGLNVTVAEIT